jgi:hypothetical protein
VRRLVLATVLVVAGCGLRPGALRVATPTTATALVEALEAKRAAVTSLRARVRLRSGLARVWTRQAILVQRPAAIRVDVLSPFGLALALGTEGRTLWAFPPQQGVRYEGPASPANLARLLGAPLAVGDLVDVLLGVPPVREATGAPTLARERDEYVLTIAFRGGVQRLRFTVDTLELTAAEESRDGGASTRVAFGDYRDGFAYGLDLVATGGQTASIAFDQVERNATIDPVAFAPPAAPRVLPLEAAATRAG